MGCDIHLYVENRATKDSAWESADVWEKEDGELTISYRDRFYHDRNYNLFAILADVRNGRGFAGVRTGDGFNPISPPKGMPEDATDNVNAEYARWGCDGHSHSFLTVEELMAFDWTQETILAGQLNGIEYADWAAWGRGQGESPKSWAGAMWGGNIQHVENSHVDAVIAEINSETKDFDYGARRAHMETKLGNLVTACEWKQKYYQCTGDFLGKTLPRLWRLGSPDNVRIVFWFDN